MYFHLTPFKQKYDCHILLTDIKLRPILQPSFHMANIFSTSCRNSYKNVSSYVKNQKVK